MNKLALVTAAGQGIGRATAEQFLAEGATVVATDISYASVASIPGVIPRPLDVTDAVSISMLAAEFPEVSVLFNCAGMVHSGTILDCPEDAFGLSLALNVTSMYRMIRAFLPGMTAMGSGSIINMSSVTSSIKGVPNRFAYGTTKAAVIGLTKSVAADYVTKGIRCNAICPGTIETPSLLQRLHDTGNFEKAYTEFTARQAMGRFGKSTEVAALVTFLASDTASFTTGQTHVIDGGWVN